jgi:hypothetical protein
LPAIVDSLFVSRMRKFHSSAAYYYFRWTAASYVGRNHQLRRLSGVSHQSRLA